MLDNSHSILWIIQFIQVESDLKINSENNIQTKWTYRTVIVPGLLVGLDRILVLAIRLLGLGVLQLDLGRGDLRQDVPHLSLGC